MRHFWKMEVKFIEGKVRYSNLSVDLAATQIFICQISLLQKFYDIQSSKFLRTFSDDVTVSFWTSDHFLL